MARPKSGPESAEKIAKAARMLFAKKGYANASLEEIATLAGFTKGAVYHFFGSKEALLLAVLQEIEERSIEATTQALQGTQGKAIDRLIRFKIIQAQWASAHPDDLAVLMWSSIESANVKSAVTIKVQHIYQRMQDLLTRIINEGVACGEFAADLPVDEVVTWLISVHDGNMLMWYRSGLDESVGRSLISASIQAVKMAVHMKHSNRQPGGAAQALRD